MKELRIGLVVFVAVFLAVGLVVWLHDARVENKQQDQERQAMLAEARDLVEACRDANRHASTLDGDGVRSEIASVKPKWEAFEARWKVRYGRKDLIYLAADSAWGAIGSARGLLWDGYTEEERRKDLWSASEMLEQCEKSLKVAAGPSE